MMRHAYWSPENEMRWFYPNHGDCYNVVVANVLVLMIDGKLAITSFPFGASTRMQPFLWVLFFLTCSFIISPCRNMCIICPNTTCDSPTWWPMLVGSCTKKWGDITLAMVSVLNLDVDVTNALVVVLEKNPCARKRKPMLAIFPSRTYTWM